MKKPDLKNLDIKKLARDFIHGKPHGERRLGDLYIPGTGLYKHREWRGIKDTMYYFNNIWLYNYGNIVMDLFRYSNGNPKVLLQFLKGTWRYRWMGQTYLTVLHWFDRGLEGLRGEALKGSAWHYRALVSASLSQIVGMFMRDANIGGDPALRAKTMAHDETVWGGVFYPFKDQMENIPLQMIPYFVTCHCNNHTVLNYIDSIQSLGLPGDPCPMCQAESGLYVEDDMPDFYPAYITTNEACDGSVATSIITDWLAQKPLFAMPQPMQFDDDTVLENCAKEMEGAWRFTEEKLGVEFHWDELVKNLEAQNELMRFEWEKTELPRLSTESSSHSTANAGSGITWTPRSERSWRSA